jgi:eukaryotic-like serine/threonine-protein kinase
MGTVVEALHLQLAQRVAIKFLLPNLCSQRDAVTRFLREARATVQIESEHVARVTDVGTTEDGVPFLVMEYLEGLDLSQLLQREKRLPVAQTVWLVVQACDAIAEAHSLGIIHRDLKPSNLFLTTRRDGTRILKVLDFGISKAITEMSSSGALATRTATATVMGSPHYMSPEQVRSSKNVDPRADIWSLGVILHELLAGEPPFKGESLPGVLASIVADPPALLRRARPDVPPGLEAIVTRCLQKDRSLRYASIPDLARALAAFAPPDAQAALLRAYSFAKPEAATQSLSPTPAAGAAASPPIGSPAPGGSSSPLPPPLVHLDTARGLAGALRPTQERRIGLLLAGVLGVLAVVFAYGGYRSERVSTTAPAAGTSLVPTASAVPQAPSASHTSDAHLTAAHWDSIEQARGTGTATPAPAGLALDDARLFIDRK